jgi:hypothetical protein
VCTAITIVRRTSYIWYGNRRTSKDGPGRTQTMSDAENTHETFETPAPPSDAAAEARRRRELRAAAAVEARYILSFRTA